MGSLPSFWRYNIVFLSFIAHVLMACAVRDDFYQLLLFFTGAFTCYFFICSEYELKKLFVFAVVFRLIWVCVTPALSDDYYRFLWDGEMICQLQNPYAETPSNLVDQEHVKSAVSEELYQNMNSPDYYTVYPPTNQMLFLTSALGNSIKSRVLILKICFFLIEFLGLFVLFRLASSKQIETSKFGLWALNPLVIVEGIGNLHFEVIVLTFMLLAYVFYRRNWKLSAAFYGLAISTKLLPLMFLPLLIPILGWKRSIAYGSVAFAVFLISFIPFFDWDLAAHMWSSIDLYFQNFEFNASIFYVVRWIGELAVGWDIVQTAGPIMALVTIAFIGFLTFKKRRVPLSLAVMALLANTFYLLMSTTVHPWYVLMPLGISIFTRLRYAVWWSLFVFLSYSFYLNGTETEKPIFLIVEYSALALLILFEIRSKGLNSQKTIPEKQHHQGVSG